MIKAKNVTPPGASSRGFVATPSAARPRARGDNASLDSDYMHFRSAKRRSFTGLNTLQSAPGKVSGGGGASADGDSVHTGLRSHDEEAAARDLINLFSDGVSDVSSTRSSPLASTKPTASPRSVMRAQRAQATSNSMASMRADLAREAALAKNRGRLGSPKAGKAAAQASRRGPFSY